MEEVKASREYFLKNNICPYCEILKVEKKGPRFIYENDSFLTFAPWASVHPFEFWIVPKKHQQTLLELDSEERKSLAKTFWAGFRGLAETLKDPPYNYCFHLAPLK